MAVRVELTDEALEDLTSYAESGNLALFLKKLIHIEEGGKDAGLPLGGRLTGWRKIVVGDRNWRIVFRMNPEETIAVVWVIGDRDDAECYEIAQQRVQALGKARPGTTSLAAIIFQLGQNRRAARRANRRRPRGT